MNQTTIEKAYELIDEIKQSKPYQAFIEVNNQIAQDSNIKLLIDVFQTAQEHYYSVKQYGTHHPDYARYSKQLIDAKETLYNNPLVKEYKQLEKALQQTLDTIAAELSHAVSKYIKTQTSIKI